MPLTLGFRLLQLPIQFFDNQLQYKVSRHIDYHSGSIGLPVPSTEAKLVDDDDNEVPPGQPGELIFNLGTGKGCSFLELVHAFEKANPSAFTSKCPKMPISW